MGGNAPIISLSLVSPDSQPFPDAQGLQTQSTPQFDSQPFSIWSEPALLVSSLTFMPFFPCGSIKPILTHSLLRPPGSSLHVGNRLTADQLQSSSLQDPNSFPHTAGHRHGGGKRVWWAVVAPKVCSQKGHASLQDICDCPGSTLHLLPGRGSRHNRLPKFKIPETLCLETF